MHFNLQKIELSDAIHKFVRTRSCRFAIDFSIITIVSLVIFRNFILSGGWPGGGDALGWVSREYIFGHDFRWLQLWRPYSFGFVEGIHSTDFFFMLINFVTQNGAATIRAFMFFTFIFAGFSMYAFAYHYTRNNLAALSASLIYVLNNWFFTQFTEAHVEILFGYALAPLLFLSLDRALKYGRIKDLAIFGVALSICLTGFNPLSVVIYMLFLALFTIFYLLTPQNNFHFWNRMKRLLKVLVFSGVIFLFLSAFYIIPFVYNARAPFYSAGFGYDLEESFTNSYGNMSDAFVLRGVEQWGYTYFVDVTSEISLQIIPVSAILLIIFLIAYSTVLIKTNRYTLFFLAAGIISIFLAKGPNPPYGNIFVWTWFNIPHFSVFRAANRFAMMAAFSHAFFISVLVSIVTNYLSKTRSVPARETHFEIVVRTSEKVIKKQKISFKPLTEALKRIKTCLHYSSILLLILILLSGFFSCWFFLQNGLQVYKPPETFLTPYEWVADQPQDFKIITASGSPAEWELRPYAETDFGSAGMITSLGWGHDIGFDSSFLHDKPVFGDGGHMARQFGNFLRFGIARRYLSDKLLKFLGTFGYKYVVLPEYAGENISSFFINQEGAKVVYNQTGSMILENGFHNGRVFGATTYMLVVGGTKSFFTTSKIGSLDFSRNVFIFANQFENPTFLREPILEGFGTILMDDSDLMDLVMLSSEDMNVMRGEEYAMSSRNDTAYWVKFPSWGDFGVLTLGGSTLTTAGENRAKIPFSVEEDGTYELMMKIGFNQHRGNLLIQVDGTPIERVHPYADSWTGLKWINLGSLYLEKGKHEIFLSNDGSGWNDIDAIAVVKSSTLENQIKQVLNDLQNYPGRIVHILSALHTFSLDIPSGWWLKRVPYQGEVLGSNSSSTFLAANTTILREDQYMFAIRLAQGPDQGIPKLQVDNKTVALRHLSSSPGVQWYEGGPLYLNPSSHLIEVGGSGIIDFDQMLIYSLEDEEASVSPDDFRIHVTELGWNIAPKGEASASSVGVWDIIALEADQANDIDPYSRWASKPHEPMPQWLQIEWETPQELTGASILFEQAYAENYTLQTWNGTDWIDQVSVEGNTAVHHIHIFEETVKTDKLRILVTSATKLYDLVSIWEIEAYTMSSFSRRVIIPQDGFYRLAFRLEFGPEYGTLNLRMNDKTVSVSCNSPENETKHIEVGPFYLQSGEQTVTVSATGIVNIDGMSMTLNDKGGFGFLDDLFEAESGPNISYEMINAGKYEAHVEDSNEPFLLIFSESYHPMWKAYIDGEEISPIPVYSIVNGFYIDKTGDFNVTISFTGQTYADIGLKISMSTLIIVGIILIIPSKKFKHWGKYIKQKIFRKNSSRLSKTKGGQL
ncbi:MAG: discoidin domain-containing protein [Candidatus Bathyarchaeum sp.]|nr:MAG: discoidin domain-containing protein [Candidatus Bathyarchaeum sp.]